ncbi:hypothetical protein BJX68DRAFT_250003 [Aspergillus pseudodeflectus]|uniref:Uncharacterized protein n=1 Tax=Aspergillus pseudodeflectus TaxID=176178 RepID=A0ABR4JB18_9EURO
MLAYRTSFDVEAQNGAMIDISQIGQGKKRNKKRVISKEDRHTLLPQISRKSPPYQLACARLIGSLLLTSSTSVQTVTRRSWEDFAPDISTLANARSPGFVIGGISAWARHRWPG